MVFRVAFFRLDRVLNQFGSSLSFAFHRGLQPLSNQLSKAMLSEIVAINPQPIVVTDRSGRILYWNSAFAAMLGLESSRLLQHTYLGDYQPEWADQRVVQQGIPAAVANSPSPERSAPGEWLGETAFLNVHGQEIPTRHLIRAHRNWRGTITRFTSVLQDLSEVQRVSTELAERSWDLEANVQQRTETLERLTQQQRSLSEVISKIRSTLNLDEIFKLAATEVRQLLTADRVGVFRFYPNSGYDDGEFVSEDVLPPYDSALRIRVHDHCFGEQYAAHYHEGRIQAVADIHQAGLQDCHVAVLSQFQIRANLIVPLMKGTELWGLLCIHQCAAPREWQASEIEFVSQIATQLGVALYQAELFHQMQQRSAELMQVNGALQQKTEELEQTLQQLGRTQSHLIQSEKLSSLGQLVAGVAHEINNPVNFIYGNLDHIHTYTQDLLELLHLYQQHLSQPPVDVQEQIERIDLEFLAEDLPRLLASMKVGADRIREIVLSLRNFSRIDQAEVKAVNLHEGIDSSLLILQHRLKPTSSRPGIEVVKQYGNLPQVECYAGQLNQVFMNLLANAIDALQEMQEARLAQEVSCPLSRVTIQTRLLEGNRVQVSIKDTGPGIRQETVDRLFNPFFTTKPMGKGTGLGLSISSDIVEKHGGTLRCISQPGQGAEFVIEIPVRQPNAVEGSRPEGAQV